MKSIIENPLGSRAHATGVSLIELMVALAIASLLTIGLIQIFGASRVTYQMQEGLSRVQENGRFATQYLERQLRMVGFMGCGSDVGRAKQGSFINHLALTDQNTIPGNKSEYRFQRPIEAFSAGTMTPSTEFTGIAGSLITGSDVLVLRVLGEQSEPLVSMVPPPDGLQLTLKVDTTNPLFAGDGKTALYAMQNCRSVDVFAAKRGASELVAAGITSPNVYKDPSIESTFCNGTAGGCPWGFAIDEANLNAKPLIGSAKLNAEIHRAEYVALFVRKNPNGIPSLYVRRFERDGTVLADSEELVEGVENLQLRFGVDSNGDGAIDGYQTAAQMVAGLTGDPLALDARWRQVLSVRVGMLLRSPGNAAVGSGAGGGPRTYDLMGITLTPLDDPAAMRQIYETTIALRNRIYNS